MTRVYRAEILGFQGSWGSGMAWLNVKDLDTKRVNAIPADSGPLGRALGDAFGAIGEGHTIDNRAIEGEIIFYIMDDLDLTLGGFVPEAEASTELWDAYEEQKTEREEVKENG